VREVRTSELRLPVLRATLVFVDSQSMLFVANDQAVVKRSVWILRRAAVLREFVDQQVVEFFKVGDREQRRQYAHEVACRYNP